MRIATWNVNSIRVRMEQVATWLVRNNIDILGIQEVRCAGEKLDWKSIVENGYTPFVYSDCGHAGVAIIVRNAIKVVGFSPGFPNEPTFENKHECRALRVSVAPSAEEIVHFWSVYVPNGRKITDEHFVYKLVWLDYFARHVRGRQNTVLLGDFNVTPRDEDVLNRDMYPNTCIHMTEPERSRILEFGFKDNIPEYVCDYGRMMQTQPFTMYRYDYRENKAGDAKLKFGMRIDLILTNMQCENVHVDKDSRKVPHPSDHAAVIATLCLDS